VLGIGELAPAGGRAPLSRRHMGEGRSPQGKGTAGRAETEMEAIGRSENVELLFISAGVLVLVLFAGGVTLLLRSGWIVSPVAAHHREFYAKLAELSASAALNGTRPDEL